MNSRHRATNLCVQQIITFRQTIMNNPDRLFHTMIQDLRNTLLDTGLLIDRHGTTAPENLVPQLDINLRTIQANADALYRLAVLLRPPNPEEYDPIKTFRILSGHIDLTLNTHNNVSLQPLICIGDSEQLYECIRLLLQNAHLQTGTRLRAEIIIEGIPRILLRFLPSGSFPIFITVDGRLDISWEQLKNTWTAATQGGHLTWSEETLSCFLRGDQAVLPTGEDAPETRIAEVMRHLARHLRPWKGAIGHYEPGYLSSDDLLPMYRKAVNDAFRTLERLPV